MRASNLLLVLLFAFGLICAGCEKSEDKSDTGTGTAATGQAESAGEKVEEAVEGVVEKSEEMHEAQVAELSKKSPGEIATELWTLINTEQYQQWKVMPGPSSFYKKDDDKKKTSVKTYVNTIAYEAMEEKNKSLPPGSIMVKERYDDQDQLQTISATINLGGNDPKDINWFWAQYSPDGKVLKSGHTGPGVKSAQ
ncbi:MAG: hypothetical protein AB1598_08995 [Thermodesulfobacteriota bacterium]